ncbi:MFS transporter [Rhizobium panacihumi]|uniref:MFS transporter n=1 Tax=Rhizobium panacihumi TaxID=2008450 RepID=UPI003D7A0B06
MFRVAENTLDQPIPPQALQPAPTLHPPSEPDYLTKGSCAYKRASIALFLSGFATFSLLYCVQPLMPLFSHDFGVTPAASSLSLSLCTGFLAFSIFLAAAISEQFGRRSLMFASLLGSAICTIICSMVTDWNLLLVIRALQGFLLGGAPAVAVAYLAEEVEPRGLGATVGLYIAGTAFGGMCGRVVTGTLVEMFTWRPALAIMGLLGLAAAIGFFRLLPPSRHFTPHRGFDPKYHLSAWFGHMRNPALPCLFAVSFLVMGAFVTSYNYIGYRLVAAPYNLGQTALGMIFTVYVFGIFASWGAGRLGDRFGAFRVMPFSLLTAAIGCMLTLFSPLPLIIAGIVLLTIGFFMSHSLASAQVAKLARGTKGHASSLYLLAYYMGSSVAGTVGGFFFAAAGWPAIVTFTVGMLVVATVCGLGAKMLAAR